MSQTFSLQGSGFTRREALRTVVLTLGGTALPGALSFFSPGARAASPSPSASPSAPPMVSNSLGGKFSLITGAGGNIAVLGGDDGVIVIDSGLPNLAARTAAEIAKSGRIALLVNTHWHPDHVGGNDLLAQAGAQIMAHENCRKRLSTDQFIEALDMKVPASAATAWPRVTFASETTLHLNGDEIRLVPVPLATPEDLRGYLAFLETMLERFTKLKNEGRTVDEVVAAAPAKEFDEKLGKGFMKPEQFVRIAYTGLLKHR